MFFIMGNGSENRAVLAVFLFAPIYCAPNTIGSVCSTCCQTVKNDRNAFIDAAFRTFFAQNELSIFSVTVLKCTKNNTISCGIC